MFLIVAKKQDLCEVAVKSRVQSAALGAGCVFHLVDQATEILARLCLDGWIVQGDVALVIPPLMSLVRSGSVPFRGGLQWVGSRNSQRAQGITIARTPPAQGERP